MQAAALNVSPNVHQARLDAFVATFAGTPGLVVQRDRPLSELARWRIGGPADVVIRPRSTADLSDIMARLHALDLPCFVMGEGSNMLFSSAGFRGVVVQIGDAMGDMAVRGGTVTCGAGAWVPMVARRLARHGLSGLEHIVGIPGTLGGLLVMNGGSQRKAVGAHVRAVTVIDRHGTVHRIDRERLDFSYRHSALQGRNLVVTEVELALAAGHSATIRNEMISILAARRRKFPKNLPNCGSTFLSDPEMYHTMGPPGQVIERLGMKGLAIGGAQVSPLHANFIVNRGGATSDEVLALVAHIRDMVRKETGFVMDCEVRHLTEHGDERPIHEFTDVRRFDLRLLGRLGNRHD